MSRRCLSTPQPLLPSLRPNLPSQVNYRLGSVRVGAAMRMHRPSAGRDAPQAVKRAVRADSVVEDRAALLKPPAPLAQRVRMRARLRLVPTVNRGRRRSARRHRKPRPDRAQLPLNGRNRLRMRPPDRSVPPLRSASKPPASGLLPNARVRNKRRIPLPVPPHPLLARQLRQRRPRNSALRRARLVRRRPTDRAGTIREHRTSSAPHRHRLLPPSNRPHLGRRLRQPRLRHPPLHRLSPARRRRLLRPPPPRRRHDRAQRHQVPLWRHPPRHSPSIRPVCGSTTCAASAGSAVKAVA